MKRTSEQKESTRRQPLSSAKAGKPDACAEIIAIARAAPSRPTFFVEAFRAIAAAFSAPYATLYVRLACEVI